MDYNNNYSTAYNLGFDTVSNLNGSGYENLILIIDSLNDGGEVAEFARFILAKALPESKIEELKKELESRGYFTDNLWHVNDVKSQLAFYNEDRMEGKILDDAECLLILESAMTNEWLIEQIFQLIYNEISE